MIKSLWSALIGLLLAGCMNSYDAKPSQSAKKVFEGEDRYVMFALEAERLQDFNSSASLFYVSYEKSQKIEYLYRSLQGYFNAQQFEKLLEYSTKYQSKYPTEVMLRRYEIFALVNLGQLKIAQQRALDLADVTKESADIILVSDIYIKENQNLEALGYLKKAYLDKYDEKILDKITTLMYVNMHQKQESIDMMENHIQNYGCSKLICMKLAALYGNENDIDSMVATYVRLYAIEPSDELAQNIVKLYGYQKNYSKLMFFLEEYHTNDELLLELYVQAKFFDKASILAKKIYDKSFVPQYLAQSAIYKYENLGNKIDKESLKTVVSNLAESVEADPKAVYLNYLGYLMIEHNIELEKGVAYVQEALKLEKDSPFYLDSLAWGYYKLHKCKEAKNIMDQVVEKIGLDEPEIKEHIKAINQCIKEKRK